MRYCFRNLDKLGELFMISGPLHSDNIVTYRILILYMDTAFHNIALNRK